MKSRIGHTILNVINIARGSHTRCKCYIHSKAFDVICHVTKVTRRIRSVEKQKLQEYKCIVGNNFPFKYVNFIYVQFHHVCDLFLQPFQAHFHKQFSSRWDEKTFIIDSTFDVLLPRLDANR